MNFELFDLVKEISNTGFYQFKSVGGSNRGQRIFDDSERRKLSVLVNENIIKLSSNDSFYMTEHGFLIAQFDSWRSYLNYIADRQQISDSKAKQDLRLGQKQIRYYKYRVVWQLLFLFLGVAITLLGKWIWLLIFPEVP